MPEWLGDTLCKGHVMAFAMRKAALLHIFVLLLTLLAVLEAQLWCIAVSLASLWTLMAALHLRTTKRERRSQRFSFQNTL